MTMKERFEAKFAFGPKSGCWARDGVYSSQTGTWLFQRCTRRAKLRERIRFPGSCTEDRDRVERAHLATCGIASTLTISISATLRTTREIATHETDGEPLKAR